MFYNTKIRPLFIRCTPKRDKSMCKLRLVEAKLISTFQIKYLMQKQQKEELNIDELLMLKAALRCYQDIKHFTF